LMRQIFCSNPILWFSKEFILYRGGKKSETHITVST
jgi:hypothetical protein